MAEVYQSPSVEEIAKILPEQFPDVKIVETKERRVKATCPREISPTSASSSTTTSHSSTARS
jgi:hypothetical protein